MANQIVVFFNLPAHLFFLLITWTNDAKKLAGVFFPVKCFSPRFVYSYSGDWNVWAESVFVSAVQLSEYSKIKPLFVFHPNGFAIKTKLNGFNAVHPFYIVEHRMDECGVRTATGAHSSRRRRTWHFRETRRPALDERLSVVYVSTNALENVHGETVKIREIIRM